ncbi:MAG: hypothetical protein ACYDC3_18755 [Candidatus Binataceae bacterium]
MLDRIKKPLFIFTAKCLAHIRSLTQHPDATRDVRPDTEVAKYRAKRAHFGIDLAPGKPLSLAFALQVRNIISRKVGNQSAPELA